MDHDVGTALRHGVGIQGKVVHPVEEVDLLGGGKGVEALERRGATVHEPGARGHAREVLGGLVEVEHEVLVVAEQDAAARLGEGAAALEDRDRVGAAVDHVAEHEDAVVGAGGHALEQPVQGHGVTMHI